jgi:hypothetical protein
LQQELVQSQNTGKLKMTKTVLFSAMKNEGPFILEWVCYHRAIGFDEIIIVSNNCDDGSDDLLNALADVGLVKHINHNVDTSQSPQGEAVKALEKEDILNDGDWIIWLDGDEFLNIHYKDGKIGSFIDSLLEVQAVMIPWRIFGDSEMQGLNVRQISDDFTRSGGDASDLSTVVKTLFRYKKGEIQVGQKGSHRPVILDGKKFENSHFITAGGKPMEMSFGKNLKWFLGGDDMNLGRVSQSEASSLLAQINHYAVRTKDVYELKKVRGRGFLREGRSAKNQKVRHNEQYFEDFNQNDVEDKTILRHREITDAEIEKTLMHPKVKKSYLEVISITNERLGARTVTASHK